jgi:hypothetical protein
MKRNKISIFDFFSKMESNLIWFKSGLPKLEKFEVKYGYKGFEIWNSFSYRNFLRFKMDFDLKIREVSRVSIWMKFCLEPQDLMKFGQKDHVCTWRKSQLMGKNLEFGQKDPISNLEFVDLFLKI